MATRHDTVPCPPADPRFWSMVDKGGPSGCWLWTGHVDSDGYGRVNRRGKVFRVHRVSYVSSRGEHDPSLVVDHLCRVRHCVNPEHLEAVTLRDNVLRGENWCATNAIVDECPSGHKYTDANTYRYPQTGGRACRSCRNARRQAEKRRARDRMRLGHGPGQPGRRSQIAARIPAANMKAGV